MYQDAAKPAYHAFPYHITMENWMTEEESNENQLLVISL